MTSSSATYKLIVQWFSWVNGSWICRNKYYSPTFCIYSESRFKQEPQWLWNVLKHVLTKCFVSFPFFFILIEFLNLDSFLTDRKKHKIYAYEWDNMGCLYT